MLNDIGSTSSVSSSRFQASALVQQRRQLYGLQQEQQPWHAPTTAQQRRELCSADRTLPEQRTPAEGLTDTM